MRSDRHRTNKKRAEEIKKFNYVADSKDLANAVIELCQRVEELEAENKRLHDKYDFQLLVKRDEQQQATIDKLVKALEFYGDGSKYQNSSHDPLHEPVAIWDCGRIARQCLAEVRGEK